MKFLFWNIRGKPLGHLVRAMVDEHDVDIVVLAEWGQDPWGILNALNARGAQRIFYTDDLPEQIAAEERAFFYNPMWGCLGDRDPGPPGTYYYDSPGHVPLFWNTFDQVLLRPDLLDMFDQHSLQIVDRAGDVTLFDTRRGRPNHRDASDHLPILFSLDLEGGNAP